MEHRHRLYLLVAIFATSLAAQARVFMTQPQALASAFPAGTKVTRQVVYLTPEQLGSARRDSGVEFNDRMIVRYAGSNAAGVVVGHAYFDTHRVRTLPETVMVVVNAESKIEKIEILSFDEPPEYLPKPRWIEQLHKRKLDDDLSLKRAVRPLSGASLSGRAIVNTSRKVLALHRVIGGK